MQQRTQIYLEPAQHAALVKEARRLGLSLAGMIRKLVEEHVLNAGPQAPSAGDRTKAALALIGLGASGLRDVSENTDEHVGRAIYEDAVKEKLPRYGRPGNKRPGRK